MTANAPLLRATSMYPRREFREPLGQTARRLRAIVAEVKAQDALAPGDRKIKQPFPPTASAHPSHPATLPAAARAWGRPARPAPAAGQRWMPPAGRRLAPPRTDRTGGWGRAACTAGAARGRLLGVATLYSADGTSHSGGKEG